MSDSTVTSQEAWFLAQPILALVGVEIEKIPAAARNHATVFLAANCLIVLMRMTGMSKEDALANVSKAIDYVGQGRPAPTSAEQN